MSDERARANAAMERYAQGDDAAFAELYDIVEPRLRGYVMRRARNVACGEEIVQHTLMQMHRARGEFTPGSNVFPWMYSIAHRYAVDCFRKDSRMMQPDPPAAPPSAEDEAIARETVERVHEEYRNLPESQRVAWELYELEGLSYAEIAEARSTTVSAVRSLLNRARATLRGAAVGEKEREAA